MLPSPRRHEIDHRTIKLLVGIIALSLAPLTSVLAKTTIESISASYYESGPSQSVFIGFLFAISALMLGYNGYTTAEMVLSKVAAIAGLGVVFFPCDCNRVGQPVPAAHWICAAAMFLILAYFCYGFFQRARAKDHPQATARAVIYAVCGIAIVLAIGVLTLNSFTDALHNAVPRTTFYGETTGLVAFGVSWLTASRTLPVITRKDERFSPLRATNPA